MPLKHSVPENIRTFHCNSQSLTSVKITKFTKQHKEAIIHLKTHI